jgi:Asp-tRNA(Asn)/Glu-tRNA(Gln) amidotransferase A subunit family amidase
VEEASPTIDAAALNRGFATVIATSVAQTLRDRGSERGTPISPEEIEIVTRICAEQGQKATALMLADANIAFQIAAASMANFLAQFDLLLTPTLAKPPALLGILGLSPADLGVFAQELASYSPFTALANMTGQPSMSVPLHWSAEGLPVGTMFTARYGEEAILLRLAAQLEKAQPWISKRPVLE